MYKYLKEKIESTSGAFIENLIFMTNEGLREKPSEAFERFFELSSKQICEVLGWKKDKEAYELVEHKIKNSELAHLMNRNNCTGFLAECHFPEVGGFKFNEGEEKPFAWAVHPGICRIEFIYADTIGELIEKLQNKSEEIFNEKVIEFKSNKNDTNYSKRRVNS